MRKLLLVLVAGLGACSQPSGPSDEAIQRYTADRAARGADAGAAVANGVAHLPVAPEAGARVRVTAVGGEGLPDADDGPGETDAYLILEYDGERHKTSVAESSLTPTWGDSFELIVRPSESLVITLMDRDGALSSDEKLGVHTEPLPLLKPGEKKIVTVAFRNGEQGTITLELEGLP